MSLACVFQHRYAMPVKLRNTLPYLPWFAACWLAEVQLGHELLQAGSSGRFIVAVAVLQPPSSAEPHLRPSLPSGKGLALEDGSLLPQLDSDSLRSHAALSQVLIDPLFQH